MLFYIAYRKLVLFLGFPPSEFQVSLDQQSYRYCGQSSTELVGGASNHFSCTGGTNIPGIPEQVVEGQFVRIQTTASGRQFLCFAEVEVSGYDVTNSK